MPSSVHAIESMEVNWRLKIQRLLCLIFTVCTSQRFLNFLSVLHESSSFCHSCFLKKRTLWSLERALNLLQLPPQHLAPEPQGSTLRLWSTAPKTLVLLTLKVPSAALGPSPPSVLLLVSPHFLSFFFNYTSVMFVGLQCDAGLCQNYMLYFHWVETMCVHACVCLLCVFVCMSMWPRIVEPVFDMLCLTW